MGALVRNHEVAIEETTWGTLQWLVGSNNGTSEHITLGRVTFKPGQSNPLHHHPNCEEVLLVISGEIEHSLPEGGSAKLRKGDCIVLPAGKPHQATNVGEKEAVVVVVFNSAERKTIGERMETNG